MHALNSFKVAAAAAVAQAPKRLALVGGMLISGREEPSIHHAVIVIEGNRIVPVGPREQVKIPADATVIDTSSKTMLPGLIDTHVHLVIVGHGDYPRCFKWLDEHGRTTRSAASSISRRSNYLWRASPRRSISAHRSRTLSMCASASRDTHRNPVSPRNNVRKRALRMVSSAKIWL